MNHSTSATDSSISISLRRFSNFLRYDHARKENL
jgi:hypothetical protein